MKVQFYQTKDGYVPMMEFLDSLDSKMKAKTIRTIELLETNGIKLRMPYSQHLQEGIFELRVKVGSNISRTLYFFFEGDKAIITHGFIKKTQRTPIAQIKKASQYKMEYERRYR